jgi:hypothetical protein
MTKVTESTWRLAVLASDWLGETKFMRSAMETDLTESPPETRLQYSNVLAKLKWADYPFEGRHGNHHYLC